MKNILTFDIEDWYQSSLDILGPEYNDAPRPAPPKENVVYNSRHLLDILTSYDVHATCFILGTVAEFYPDLVREIHSAGHEIATHGYGHELVYNLTKEAFRADIQHSIELLKSINDEPICGYRAPYFSITRKSKWALDVLVELGIQYDSSIFPIKRKLYGFPGWERYPHTVDVRNDCSLFELPISTFNIFGQNFPIGGGGYFRLLPYTLIREAIQAINRKNQPAVFYLHPYELDRDELRHPLHNETLKTSIVRHSQRVNRSKTEAKLRRLLKDFQWTSVREWINEYL